MLSMCWPCSARINQVLADSIAGYVEKGIALGKRPELTGGGLIRSLGGWGQAKALRKTGALLKSDERILDIGHSAISRSAQRGEKIAETKDFARQLEKNRYSWALNTLTDAIFSLLLSEKIQKIYPSMQSNGPLIRKYRNGVNLARVKTNRHFLGLMGRLCLYALLSVKANFRSREMPLHFLAERLTKNWLILRRRAMSTASKPNSLCAK